jgi:predicted peroxiredoxin
MGRYLLIESRDPFESNDAAQFAHLAAALAAAGDEVTVFLVQNGVLPARRGARAGALAELAAGGVRVLADDFSLRERAIPVERLAPGIAAASLELVVDRMARGDKTIWH